MERLLAVNK